MLAPAVTSLSPDQAILDQGLDCARDRAVRHPRTEVSLSRRSMLTQMVKDRLIVLPGLARVMRWPSRDPAPREYLADTALVPLRALGWVEAFRGQFGRPVATRTPLRQIMAGTPEQVRETVEVFLALKENSDA